MDTCQYCDQPIAAGFDSLCENHLAMCIPCAEHHARDEAQHGNCVQVDCYCLGCHAPARTVQCVHLERAEGLTWECSMEHVVFSLEDAESQLYAWAWTAPEPGQGYHKADVRVEYTNGTSQYIRADLQRGRYGYLPA